MYKSINKIFLLHGLLLPGHLRSLDTLFGGCGGADQIWPQQTSTTSHTAEWLLLGHLRSPSLYALFDGVGGEVTRRPQHFTTTPHLARCEYLGLVIFSFFLLISTNFFTLPGIFVYIYFAPLYNFRLLSDSFPIP